MSTLVNNFLNDKSDKIQGCIKSLHNSLILFTNSLIIKTAKYFSFFLTNIFVFYVNFVFYVKSKYSFFYKKYPYFKIAIVYLEYYIILIKYKAVNS